MRQITKSRYAVAAFLQNNRREVEVGELLTDLSITGQRELKAADGVVNKGVEAGGYDQVVGHKSGYVLESPTQGGEVCFIFSTEWQRVVMVMPATFTAPTFSLEATTIRISEQGIGVQ